MIATGGDILAPVGLDQFWYNKINMKYHIIITTLMDQKPLILHGKYHGSC